MNNEPLGFPKIYPDALNVFRVGDETT